MPEPRHAARGEATPSTGYVGRHRHPDDVTIAATQTQADRDRVLGYPSSAPSSAPTRIDSDEF